jgi:methionyl-tRNA formyltransferase
MRVLLLANNWVGWKVTEWLAEQPDTEIVGVVVHPSDKQRYADEILNCCKLSQDCIFDGSHLDQQEVIDAVKALQPEIGISLLFDYILQVPFIELFSKGVINLHPAYLPYNRGSYPNVWSIVEDTPSGVTMHYIDKGIDTGDIIAQKEVPISSTDTGETLYEKLEHASVELFQKTWVDVVSDTITRVPQDVSGGTVHRSRDVEKIDTLDLDYEYQARDLLNILRSRTFPPYSGAFFRDPEGKKVFVRVQLEYADDEH